METSGSEFRDGLLAGRVSGRGAGLNPGNRFETIRLHVLGEHLDEIAMEQPGGVQVRTRVFRDRTKSLINSVDSPDLPMRWTINPYRGCEHGCIYCYARPGHEYLGLSSGLDFETKIFAKMEAAEILRDELARPAWNGEPISMSGVTDPYQPVEARLRITRGCVEVMRECMQPFSIVTKNRLVTRDLDLLAPMAAARAVSVAVSITTLDNRLASKMEPRASSPRERLAAIRELTGAGVPVAVMTAPIIPGLNDHEVPAILEAAAGEGASGAGYVLLKLPYQIKALFLDWLAREFPDRAAKVESLMRQARGGELYSARFFERQKGVGARADQIGQAFRVFKKRFGLDKPTWSLRSDGFRRPLPRAERGQGRLF
ncbi:MAG: PA0069 family radical SAM protein [Phycisphaeraceae bacterium]|nr:PA0069 family radical SAM protein [Phycisphaeraceae bacterium]